MRNLSLQRMLEPVLFILYIAAPQQIAMRHSLLPHFYADATQMFGSCRPSDVNQLQRRVSASIDDVGSWMRWTPAEHGKD